MRKHRLVRLFAVIILLLSMSGCAPEPDFYTNHGLGVTVGAKNNPGPKLIEFWTDQTILFWRFHYPHWLQCMNDATTKTHAFFYDEDFVMNGDRKVAGVAHSSDLTIEISNGDQKKVRGVFIHELSHVYLGECGGVWTNDGSHAVFKEVNLQWLTAY